MPNSKNIQDIVMFCLFKSDELPKSGSTPENAVLVEGITKKYGFHPDRLNEKRNEITTELETLPVNFFTKVEGGGGGWSFLQACMDKNGVQWGEHQSMEMLFVLGMAIGVVQSQFPREIWPSLPGGMPYYLVNFQ